MAEKTLKTRIIQKHDTEANWSLATNFTPLNGEIIIYDEDENYNYKRIKIGNGIDNVNDLPFTIDNAQNRIDENLETESKSVVGAINELKENFSWNNLLDRPFYENISGDVLLEEQTINLQNPVDNAYFIDISASLAVTQGNEYTVIWDGIPYKVTVKTTSGGSRYLGNLYWGGSSPNTGEPFFIAFNNDGTLYVAAETQGEHTLEVYSDYNYELKQLDEKFIPNISTDKLPDISWNNLKDKPFYENISGDVLLEEQAITLSEDNGNGRYFTNYTILSPLQLTAEEKYIVIWDGIPCETVYTDGILGNLNAYHSQAPDSGEPFFIGVSGSSLHICCAEQGEHTFAIYSSNYNCEVKQLDEKFIPNISWNNLSDKPFYENISGDVLLEERTVNFSNPYNSAYIASINASLELTQGNEYTVLWDGVPYTLIFDTQNNSLGNPYLVGGPDSGEPFFISVGGNVTVFAETQGEHTFAIYANYNCEVKQLDSKFIPDTSWNNLSDKPFYESITGDILLEEQTVDCSESTGNGYSTNINASLAVTQGNEYTVIWDGIPYKVTCPNNSNILGNNNIRYSGNENTGEPFFIGFTGSSIDVFAETQGEHTFAIYSSDYNYELKQLDEKFIPNISTDKLPDISWNNLTDKPFYENISGDILLAKTVDCSESTGNGYKTTVQTALQYTVGNEYTVLWDGVPYTLTATNRPLWGNEYLFRGGSAPNTGEPFCINISGLSIDIFADTQGEHTLVIYSDYSSEVKQLDSKFIPDTSWNDLTDKPFYENISYDVLLEEQTINCSIASGRKYETTIYRVLSYTAGEEYIVVWDGVQYKITPTNNAWGNPYLTGSPHNTGEPFYIRLDDTSTCVISDKGKHTLAIYYNYNQELKQLDEKFIPDTIARVEDLNNIDLSLYQTKEDENLTTTDKTIVGAINELNNNLANTSNSGVGKSTTGTVYTINNTEVTAKEGAEIFNSYSNNIASGLYSHAEGYYGKASGDYSHAEGHSTKAEGYISHAEGFTTYATGSWSHAEGHSSVASGITSHAEGGSSTASGHTSHAEGNGTTASGDQSHAEGSSTTASGDYSHAEGKNTIASGSYQHVQGKYNIEDTENKYAHIVGNGEGLKKRSNAHTLDWNGNAWYAGDVQATDTEGNTVSLVEVTEKVNDIDLTKDWNENDETSSKFIKNRTHYTTDPAYLQEQINRKPDFYDVFLEDFGLYWANLNYKVDTDKIKPNLINGRGVKLTFNETVYEFTLQHEEVLSDTTTTIYLIGNKSLLNAKTSQSFEDTGEPFVFEINVYNDNIKSCDIYAKEITENNVIFSIQEVTDIQLDEKYISYKPGLKTVGNTYTINDVEVTAKEGAEIFNDYANNIATGDYSHAEGYCTIASGTEAHAEGHGTTASGYGSHAEGQATSATGNRSHAEGSWTIASGKYQHVQGKYNINDVDTDGNPLNTYAHIVGNGDSDNARSNAHTLDWNGNAEYQGDVKANACGGENPISLVELYNELQAVKAELATLKATYAELTETDANALVKEVFD